MDNLENFLAAGQPVEDEAVTEQPEVEAVAETPAEEAPEATETPEQTAQRVRDEKGRFKAKEDKPDPVMVPLQALHETRDELKALKAELEQLRQPKPAEQQRAVPDIFEDPEGFVNYQNEQIQRTALNTTLNVSESLTRQAIGNELVDEAQQWGKAQFEANPALAQQFFAQANPYGFLVEQYKKAQLMSQIGDDPSTIEEFLAWKQAKAQPTPAPAPVPTTLADAQSARGSADVFRVPSFEEILTRK